MSHQENIIRIKSVNTLLQSIDVNFAFIGGATVSLYAQREATDVRPTEDIDIVVEIATYGTEYTRLTEKLLKMGFSPDTESNVICRYLHTGLIIDVMPVDDDVLGFTNKWYKDGLKNAIDYVIDDQSTVKIFSAPYFIASKFEAFNSRGKNDGRQSTDFEDIVFVMDNRPSVWEEIQNADSAVRKYIQHQLRALSSNPQMEEWIMCHLEVSSPITYPQHIIDGIKNTIN